MSAYTTFASVYDSFMSHIPYEEWAKLIDEYFKNNNISGNILELGCGTGRFSFLLEERGYNVVGIDNSPDMIKAAEHNARARHSSCRFTLQDMRVIEQEQKYNAVVSVCDSMNYLREEFDLESVFEGVASVLTKDGIFLFDMKTESFYKSLGDNVFTDENEMGSYIWKNYYDEATRDNSYELTFFIHKKKNLYIKETEEHIQHVFTEEEVKRCATRAGLKVRAILGMDLKAPGDFASQRIYYVVERKK